MENENNWKEDNTKPSVGLIVTYQSKGHPKSDATMDWKDGDELEIIHQQFSLDVVAVKNLRTDTVATLIMECMQPIRTIEERAKELAVEAIMRDLFVTKLIAELIYDKGYLKPEPVENINVGEFMEFNAECADKDYFLHVTMAARMLELYNISAK